MHLKLPSPVRPVTRHCSAIVASVQARRVAPPVALTASGSLFDALPSALEHLND